MKKHLVLLSLLVATMAARSAPVDITAYAAPIRVTCVGDSITYGVGTTKGNSYPSQLGRMLGAKWVVKNFGVNSATLLKHGNKPYQKQAAFQKALASEPDVVVIKLGTNDTKPENWAHKDEFIADYEDLIRRFASLPSKPHIYICRPAFVPAPGNYTINEAGVLAEIPLLDKIAADTSATVVDPHAPLQAHPELLPDRVHPNNQGATILAKTVYQAIIGVEYSGADPVVSSALDAH